MNTDSFIQPLLQTWWSFYFLPLGNPVNSLFQGRTSGYTLGRIRWQNHLLLVQKKELSCKPRTPFLKGLHGSLNYFTLLVRSSHKYFFIFWIFLLPLILPIKKAHLCSFTSFLILNGYKDKKDKPSGYYWSKVCNYILKC